MLLKNKDFTRPQYWLFSANPNDYLITKALQDSSVDWNWMVKQHRDKIREGDKVIIWVCGKRAGVYALATITSEVFPFRTENDPYIVDKSIDESQPRVRLHIDKNFVTAPILKEALSQNPELKKMTQFYRQTNNRSEPAYYEALYLLSKF